MRKRMNAGLDRRTFRRTAQTTKKINLNPSIYRGGIRL